MNEDLKTDEDGCRYFETEQIVNGRKLLLTYYAAPKCVMTATVIEDAPNS